MMEIHDSTVIYKEKTTDELRTSYKNIGEELVLRRDEEFYKIKKDLVKILAQIQEEGYKLQAIDYDDNERRIEIRNVMQFDLYDPVIETSEI